MSTLRRDDWRGRGGSISLSKSDGLCFTEDHGDEIHGVWGVVGAPSDEGIGLRMRVRAPRRPQMLIWLRRLKSEETFMVSVDFEQISLFFPRHAGGSSPLTGSIVALEPNLFEVWIAFRDPQNTYAYRIDVISRLSGEGSSAYEGDGQLTFTVEDLELAHPSSTLFDIHARARGFAAEAKFATLQDYYQTFFTPAHLQRAMEKVRPADSASRLFELMRRETMPPIQLSPRDLSMRWLDTDESGVFAFDLSASDFVDALSDNSFVHALATATHIRGAIEVPFASDGGATRLSAVVAAERSCGRGARAIERELLEYSPRLLVAALFEAAGYEASAPYLTDLDTSVFCFDPRVLTRQYLENPGAPMARRGRVHVRLERLASAESDVAQYEYLEAAE